MTSGGNRVHAVLLAGGSGTRFWPLSRRRRPKQFLPLAGRDSLLAGTWKRVRKLAPPSRIWVATPAALVEDVRAALPRLPPGNVVVEPSPRDTAPAIALACESVARRDPEALVAVFPTDHVIPDVEAFVRSVNVALEAARRGHLVCLGVLPDRPATGFGYLKCRRRPRGVEAVPIERFVEKPDESRARRFLRAGTYLWNAGMFVWRARRFLDEFDRLLPATGLAVKAFSDGRAEAWKEAERISVDYGVMEKAQDVRVVPLRAGWNDVGSWDAAARLRGDGTSGGKSSPVLVDSDGSAVFGDGRLVAVVGVPGVVVVDTDDALLVVARDRSEDVRRVVKTLESRRREDLL